MGDLKEEIIAKTMGITQKPEQTVDGVKKEAEDMDVIDKAMGTAKKLAGTDALAEELKNKDRKLEESEKEKNKVTEELQETRMQVIQKELGGKIDQLSNAIKSGASTKSIGTQISEIKEVAGDLGLGTSKVSEFKEMASLIQNLNPQKGLAEQVKEAKDLLTTLQPEKGKEAHVEGIPAEIALEIKKMDTNLQITLEQMKDDRQRKDHEFQLTVKKWDEERDTRRQEIAGKLDVERERNKLISGGLETVGKAIGKGYAESGREVAAHPGGISQGQLGGTQNYKITAGVGDSGEVECPRCHTMVGIGPNSDLAECVGCNTKFDVERGPAEKPAETVAEEETE